MQAREEKPNWRHSSYDGMFIAERMALLREMVLLLLLQLLLLLMGLVSLFTRFKRQQQQMLGVILSLNQFA